MNVNIKSTKAEMMEAISNLQKELTEKEKNTLNPEKIKQDQKEESVIQKAESTVETDLHAKINSLKASIGKELSEINEKLESEVTNYKNLLEAINVKKRELANIYGIEKEALNFAVILEAQKKQKADFDSESKAKQETLELTLKNKKDILETEIHDLKSNWEKEKKLYIDAVKEEKSATEKERKREAEEYIYKIKREREIEQNKYNDELEKVKKDISGKKEEYEKFYKIKTEELSVREEAVEVREKKMQQLEQTVAEYPAELEKAVNKAVLETDKRITSDFKKNEIMINHIHVGEINVLNAKISALEATVKDQIKQIEKLTLSQEQAYEKVQNIANKAVDGASERMRNITVKMPSKSDEN